MSQQQPVPASRPAGPVPPHQPDSPARDASSELRTDEVFSHVVHELYAAGLDLCSALCLLPGHLRLAEDKVQAVITRLDATIGTIHQAGARLAMARTEPVIDALIALPDGIDLMHYLHTLARHCVHLLGLDAAAIVLPDQGVASAGPVATRAGELCQLREGPCHDTCETGQPVTATDLAVTSRWPLFTARARTAGFQAVHTLPLSFAGSSLGALALFSTSAYEPSDSAVQLAEGVAGFAAVAVTCDGVHAAEPITHVGGQPVVASEPGQHQRVTEVVVRTADQTSVETHPARQVPQIGQRDVEPPPYLFRRRGSEQWNAFPDPLPDIVETRLATAAVVHRAQGTDVLLQARDVGKTDHGDQHS